MSSALHSVPGWQQGFIQNRNASFSSSTYTKRAASAGAQLGHSSGIELPAKLFLGLSPHLFRPCGCFWEGFVDSHSCPLYTPSSIDSVPSLFFFNVSGSCSHSFKTKFVTLTITHLDSPSVVLRLWRFHGNLKKRNRGKWPGSFRVLPLGNKY